MKVQEDIQKEHEKETGKLKKVILELLDMVASLKNRNAELDEKRKKALHDYYETAAELEEAKALIVKLTAQVNHNYENSSLPSSRCIFARESKGHAGIRDTPVETFGGILVHDHEACFYGYSSDHQECMVHIERYLKDSIENEKGLTWNGQMLELIREMIQENNSARKGLRMKRSPGLRKGTMRWSGQLQRSMRTARHQIITGMATTCTCGWWNTGITISCSCQTHWWILITTCAGGKPGS